MGKIVKPYDLERISSRLAKVFGKIAKGEEEEHSMVLSNMESNMLKIWSKHDEVYGMHAKEAVMICLMKVDGYINSMEYDFTNVINYQNEKLTWALLMSFDPYTNEEIGSFLFKMKDFDDKEDKMSYYEEPAKCLMRIEKSIEFWTKINGKDGYFDFVNSQLASLIQNDKMNFSLLLDEKEIAGLGFDWSEE